MDSDGSTTVVLTVSSAAWRAALGDLEPLAERIVGATLEQAAKARWLAAGEVSLLLTDDCEIRSLNATYRSKDRATNVLSFPGLDLVEGTALQGNAAERAATASPPPGPVLLGDVAISLDRLRAEAAAEEKALHDHFAHLLVHGTLHLLGYDHDDDAQAEIMERLEASILETLGFAAPYAPVSEADAVDAVT